MRAVGLHGFLDVDEQVAEIEDGEASVALPQYPSTTAHHTRPHAQVELDF